MKVLNGFHIIVFDAELYKHGSNDYVVFCFPHSCFLGLIVGTMLGLSEFSTEVYTKSLDSLTIRFQNDVYTVGFHQRSHLTVVFSYQRKWKINQMLIGEILRRLLELFEEKHLHLEECLENLNQLLHRSPHLLSDSLWKISSCEISLFQQSVPRVLGLFSMNSSELELAVFYDGICIFANFKNRVLEVVLEILPIAALKDWVPLGINQYLTVSIGRYKCVLRTAATKPRLLRKFRRNAVLSLLKLATSLPKPPCCFCELYRAEGSQFWCSVELDSVKKICQIHNFRTFSIEGSLPLVDLYEVWLTETLGEICGNIEAFEYHKCYMDDLEIEFVKVPYQNVINVNCHRVQN